MAFLNHRRYLGYEVHEPYYRRAVERLTDARAVYRRVLDAAIAGVPILPSNQRKECDVQAVLKAERI